MPRYHTYVHYSVDSEELVGLDAGVDEGREGRGGEGRVGRVHPLWSDGMRPISDRRIKVGQ